MKQYLFVIFVAAHFLFITQKSSGQGIDGTWSTESSTGFTPRYGLTSCEIEGKIYAIGGGDQYGVHNTFEVFDPATNTWNTPVTTGTFAPHFAHTSSVLGDKIYVIGGDVASDSAVAIFDPSTNAWSTISKTSGSFTRRLYLTSCVLDGKIYAIGGVINVAHGPYIVLNTVEIFDPVTLSWTVPAMTDTLRTVMTPTSHVINGKIYVIGKPNDYSSPANIVQVFDPLTHAWTTPQVTGAPMLREYFASSEVNGKIYVIGGDDWVHSDVAINLVEIFDPSTNAWSVPTTTGTFTARDNLTSSVVDGKIYAMGGTNNTAVNTNTNEVLTLAASGVTSVGALPDIKLFPNPTDGIINVQNVPSVMENIIVVNVLGETVMELKNLDSQDFTLDLSKLTPGTYYVRFISAKSVTTKMALRN